MCEGKKAQAIGRGTIAKTNQRQSKKYTKVEKMASIRNGGGNNTTAIDNVQLVSAKNGKARLLESS